MSDDRDQRKTYTKLWRKIKKSMVIRMFECSIHLGSLATLKQYCYLRIRNKIKFKSDENKRFTQFCSKIQKMIKYM